MLGGNGWTGFDCLFDAGYLQIFVRAVPAVIEQMYSQINESDSAFESGSQEGKHCLDQVTQEMHC